MSWSHGALKSVPILNTISAATSRAPSSNGRWVKSTQAPPISSAIPWAPYLGFMAARVFLQSLRRDGSSPPCEPPRGSTDGFAAAGLSAAFYLPVSHVLRPWTPSVIETAIDRALPLAKPRGDAAHQHADYALAWGSLVVMMCIR